MALALGPVIGQIGGGSQVEEHPVSASVTNTWAPVLTVTPSGRALVVVTGLASIGGAGYMLFRLGGQTSVNLQAGSVSHAAVVEAASDVEVWRSFNASNTTFTGMVYVVPLPD